MFSNAASIRCINKIFPSCNNLCPRSICWLSNIFIFFGQTWIIHSMTNNEIINPISSNWNVTYEIIFIFFICFFFRYFSSFFHMHIQKRAVNFEACDDFIEKSSMPIEQINHQYWRRFMNERAISRAYIPTDHGIFCFSSILIMGT
jgi:hypothetical protein